MGVSYTEGGHGGQRVILVPHGTEQGGASCHHGTQGGVRFKTYKLLVVGISHLIFLYSR